MSPYTFLRSYLTPSHGMHIRLIPSRRPADGRYEETLIVLFPASPFQSSHETFLQKIFQELLSGY